MARKSHCVFRQQRFPFQRPVLAADFCRASQPGSNELQLDVFVVGDVSVWAARREVPLVDLFHRTAIAADWSLVIEIHESVIGQGFGENRRGNCWYSIKTPGPQGISAFEHQIPVEKGMVVLKQYKPRHGRRLAASHDEFVERNLIQRIVDARLEQSFQQQSQLSHLKRTDAQVAHQ